MGREIKKPEPEGAAGAPEWMVTFSDCMTLLLTFFVLLLSFSSFDEYTFRRLRLIFCKALPGVSRPTKEGKDAFLTAVEQIVPTEDLGEGSEKPTLARGWKGNLKEETKPQEFHSRKVFLISSKKIFWGKGIAISSEGRDIMATMALFLKEVPSRVVISENGTGGERGGEQFGLSRAWVVMEYLTKKQGLDKRRFSISAASTVAGLGAQGSFESGEIGGLGSEAERMLEIVLLERSIYN